MIKTPLNQQRQTNIAIVRMKIKNKKFEIPAYKNKVVSWRTGAEKDLNEVLQTVKVFSNVSKGELAKREDLIKYFNEEDEQKVCITILNKGELQISSKEREVMYDSMYRDIVTIVCNLCINPDTQRPYPSGVIDRALKEIHFSVKPGKSAKKQALEVIRKLKKAIPIERAQMRLEICLTQANLAKKIKTILKSGEATIEKDIYNPENKTVHLTVLIDPGMFRAIDEFANENAEYCIVSVLDTTVLREGEERIDDILSDEEESEQIQAAKKEESPDRKQAKKKQGKKDKKPADAGLEAESDKDSSNKKSSTSGGKKKEKKSQRRSSEQEEEPEESDEFSTMKKRTVKKKAQNISK